MKKSIMKIMAVLAIFGMLSGCATIQGWLGKTVCSPTADQIVSYAQQIADASDSLAYFESLIPTIPIMAIIAGLKLAIKVLSDARDGICQDPVQLASAQEQVKTSKNLAMQLKAGKSLMLVK
jgi:predicted small secreted protein